MSLFNWRGAGQGSRQISILPFHLFSLSLSISFVNKKEEKMSFLNFLVPFPYYKYFLFRIFFRDKWSRCGAVLSYAEEYHHEIDKQSGIVIGPFYFKHYFLIFFFGIVSYFSVSPFAFVNIEIPVLILKFLWTWAKSFKSISY